MLLQNKLTIFNSLVSFVKLIECQLHARTTHSNVTDGEHQLFRVKHTCTWKTPIKPLEKYPWRKALWKSMKEVNPLHDDILISKVNTQLSTFPFVLQKHFPNAIQNCSAGPIGSISRWTRHIFNTIILPNASLLLHYLGLHSCAHSG